MRPDGTFNFGNVHGGDVYVSVVTAPDSKYFVKSIDANGGDPRHTPLKIAEGADAGPLKVVISEEISTVTGRVFASDGAQGLGDLVVLLAPVDPAKQRFRTAYLSTRTRADGGFSISGTPGEYYVIARQRHALPPIVTEEFVRATAAKATRVTLTSGQQLQLDVRVQ